MKQRKTKETGLCDLGEVANNFTKLIGDHNKCLILNQKEERVFLKDLETSINSLYDTFDYTYPLFKNSINYTLNTGIQMLERCDQYLGNRLR